MDDASSSRQILAGGTGDGDKSVPAPLTAKEIAEESLRFAGDICVYTNGDIVVEEI